MSHYKIQSIGSLVGVDVPQSPAVYSIEQAQRFEAELHKAIKAAIQFRAEGVESKRIAKEIEEGRS